MVLETLQKGAPINIHNLTIEQLGMRDSGLRFDLKRDISKAERQVIEEVLNEEAYNYVNSVEGGLELYTPYLELFPERRLNILLSEWPPEPPTDGIIPEGMSIRGIKVAFPNLTPQQIIEDLIRGSDEEVEKEFENTVNYFKSGLPERNKESALYEIMVAKMLVPEKFSQETVASTVLRDIKYMINNRRKDGREYELMDFGATAAIMLGKPEPLELTEYDWLNMRKTLEDFRKNKRWSKFIWAAANMAILAADEIIVDETGIHRIYHPKPEFTTRPIALPYQRKF